MKNFQNVLTNIGLSDLGYEGPKFTWKGPEQGSDFILARLDRGLVCFFFSNLSFCTVLNTSVSHPDHLALIISLFQSPICRNRNNPKKNALSHIG